MEHCGPCSIEHRRPGTMESRQAKNAYHDWNTFSNCARIGSPEHQRAHEARSVKGQHR